MPKLLLADDSVTIQRVIELTFSGEDVQVVTVGDGEEAIARIPAERPDIVLADIGMPKRSGYDVAAFVKGHPEFGHIPVLLLAGAFEPVDQSRAEQVGCDGVLVKPFEPQQVVARVRELIEGAKGSAAQATAGVPRPIERLGPSHGREPVPQRQPSFDPAATRPGAAPDRPDIEARVIETRPIVEMPEPSAPPVSSDSLDDYFDRLDAAFASLGTTPGGPPAAAPSSQSPALDDLAANVEVPTIDELLGQVPARSVPGDLPGTATRVAAPPLEPADAVPAMTPSPRARSAASPDRTGPPDSRNVIADVFSALLAAEQGEGASAVQLPAGPDPPVTDALVDEVTRRVLERITPAAAKDVVASIVSEVAERLVREEIARIRSRA